MAVTVYQQGSWRIVFEDSTEIVISIGGNDYFIGIVDGDTKRLLISQSIVHFNKNIVQIEEV